MFFVKERFFLPVCLASLCLFSCCPKPDINSPPQILAMPDLIMSQNQDYVLNLSLYAIDDRDFGEKLSWSVFIDNEALIDIVIDQEKQRLILSSGVSVGLVEIGLIVTDSEGLASEKQNFKVEVKDGTLVGSDGEAKFFTFNFGLRPEGVGFVNCDHLPGNYLSGIEVTVDCYPLEGWKFDYWEGPVKDAFANPVSVCIVSDTLVVAVCSSIIPLETDCDIDSPEIFFRFLVMAADSGGDSELSWEEIKTKFPKLSVIYRPLIMSADTDNNGQVSEAEFVSSSIPELLLALNGAPDENGDNAITQQELAEVISGVSVDDFRSLDTNSNGVLDCADL
jgi:hypothetical protein